MSERYQGGSNFNSGIVNAQEERISPATEGTLQSIAGFNIPQFDTIDATYPDLVTEVYTYKLNSVDVGSITVTYTNSTKNVLLSVTKL